MTMMRGLLIFWLIFCYAGTVSAQSLSRTKAPDIASGTSIEFIEGEFVLAKGIETPDTGWQPGTNPNLDLKNKTGQRIGDYRALTGRFYFDREAVGTDPIAIYTIGMRSNFSVSVNGTEMFRNFSDFDDQKNSWYRPFLIPVPDSVLKPGVNEIVIHSFSKRIVGVGRVIIGSHPALQAEYKSRFFWNITAPMATNFATLFVGSLVFIFWLARRHEIELLWVSISAALWFLRNHEYYTETVPFNVLLYRSLTISSTYFAAAASVAFYFCFIKLPHRNRIITLIFVAGIPFALLQVVFPLSNIVLYVATGIITLLVAIVGIRDLSSNPSFERGVLGVGMMLMPLAGLYDFIVFVIYEGDGHATYLSVFVGLIFSGIFMLSFGERVLVVLTKLGQSNLILEQGISKARAELAESEAIRRELMVDQAIANERERLMQEMHDGIGSNLTTALAVARQQNQPSTTVKVLKRALGDLKLTVDSLEPIEGDLVALIGNLRHRMARDLADAGITCKWEVEDCAPLAWLDATNALHVLRIHNEAISNVLAHSNATEMRIGCVESEHEGVAGISTYVADNGVGLDLSMEIQGKGLANIRARAHSLHGLLFCEAQPSGGTIIRLWLPYIR